MKKNNLNFLNECSNEQLKLLVDFIIYDSDGQKRWTEELTTRKDFMINYPNNLVKCVPHIIDELQRFGGNTFRNKIRGHGVPYREILENVCNQLKVNYNKNNDTPLLEHYLLQKILLMSIEKMSEEDVQHLSKHYTKDMLKKKIGLLKAGSPLFIRLITMIIAKLAKKWGMQQAAKLAVDFAGSKAFTILAGPIGWVLSSLWTVYDIAGPAYRVMIPCTITIAYLRIVSEKTEDELNEILK
jgi:uncharacterized protein YaaW (UPF0174 family)